MAASLRLRARLAAAFGAVLLMLLAVAAIAILEMRSLQAIDARQAALHATRADVAAWAAATRLNVVRAVTLAKAGSPPSIAPWLDAEIKKTSASITGLQKRLDVALDLPQHKDVLAGMAERRKEYLSVRAALLKRMADPRDVAAAQAEVDTRLSPLADAYLGELDKLAAGVDAQVQALDAERLAAVQRAQWLLPSLTLAALLLGAVLATGVANGLALPLREVQEAVRRIAGGDLSQPVAVTRSDEVGQLQQAVAGMQDSLRQMVGGIRSGTEGVGSATSQIASGNQDLSARTERAASNLQQTAATMAQLSDAIRESAGSASRANELAATAAEVARQGGDIVSQVVGTMAEINAGSGRISEITGVIDSIAFQTNILALNAAVEAARAGEEGRGFAVVAQEVRSLAGRCADAAREIRGLIEESVRKAETGARLVKDAGGTMAAIQHSVQDVSQAIAGVTGATASQATGIGEVTRAVAQLDDITQQNAALVEQASAAAESLREQAQSLGRLVGSFRLAPGMA
ncbi:MULTISPECIES: methyl-accepting chemotaxis protein [Ramlibacter]|uniref:HAMP domain-containing protein n=1 Tax=Ramlibacter aquaticus TaxID=2780094 RepID=A0ABR9SAC6_9BURK|nr:MULTISPECIES: methyl-accepting chemotaxis protein [Ramlibacter]MBE7939281.1 HAMP domain-containing protein [Ramlibacter aquaticus]